MGLISGLLGALFVEVSSRLGILRKKYIRTNIAKILEATLFSFATASTFYYVPALSQCRSLVSLNEEAHDLAV